MNGGKLGGIHFDRNANKAFNHRRHLVWHLELMEVPCAHGAPEKEIGL